MQTGFRSSTMAFISHPIAGYVSPWVPHGHHDDGGWGKGQRLADIQLSSAPRTKTPLHLAVCAWKMWHILPAYAKDLAAPYPLPPFLGRCWLFCWLDQEGRFVARSQILKRHWSLQDNQAEETLLGLQEPCNPRVKTTTKMEWVQNCQTESGLSSSVHVCLESNFISPCFTFYRTYLWLCVYLNSFRFTE